MLQSAHGRFLAFPRCAKFFLVAFFALIADRLEETMLSVVRTLQIPATICLDCHIYKCNHWHSSNALQIKTLHNYIYMLLSN